MRFFKMEIQSGISMDFYQIFPVRSFAKKSNQMLSNMLFKIRIHFLKMQIQSNSIKNSIPHFYPL